MSRYAIIIEEGPTSFGAYSPDLPGCVAAGDSREETVRLMREAIEMHVTAIRESGEPLPAPSTSVAYVEV